VTQTDLFRLPVGRQSLDALYSRPKPPQQEAGSHPIKPLRPKRATLSGPDRVQEPPPLVIMIHDLPFGTMRDHEDLFGRIDTLSVDLGFHGLRFDFRGCGSSAPPPGGLPTLGSASQDLGAAFDWGKAQGYRKFILVAEGLSASLALPRMTEDSVLAAILLWPVLDPKALALEKFGAIAEMDAPAPDAILEAHGKKISARLAYEMVRTDLSGVMKRVTTPILIQQGDRDSATIAGQIDLARKTLRSKRLDITAYSDADRGLTDARHRKYMLYHIQQFIEKFLDSLPPA